MKKAKNPNPNTWCSYFLTLTLCRGGTATDSAPLWTLTLTLGAILFSLFSLFLDPNPNTWSSSSRELTDGDNNGEKKRERPSKSVFPSLCLSR